MGENLLLLVHQLAAIVWLGGVLALNTLQLRLGSGSDSATRSSLLRLIDLYGRTVIAPSGIVVLLTGVVLVEQAGVAWTAAWVLWGLLGIALSIALGATLIRVNNAELRRLADQQPGDEPLWGSRQRRAAILYGINLLILLSVLAAMVFRPTL